jgi:uncharacterized cupredoxin-like copper-binding protein
MRIPFAVVLSTLAFGAPSALAHSDHSHDAPRGARTPAPAAAAKEYGRPGNASTASRTVQLEITGKAGCNPAEIAAKQGETLKLIAKNASSVPQELAIGNAAELKSHAETVRKFPKMQGSQANRVSVKPGESAELVWQFTNAGQFIVACVPPGQFDAASAGKIVVSGR